LQNMDNETLASPEAIMLKTAHLLQSIGISDPVARLVGNNAFELPKYRSRLGISYRQYLAFAACITLLIAVGAWFYLPALSDRALLIGKLADGERVSAGKPNPTDTQDDPNARLIPIKPNAGQPPVQVVTTTVPPAPASPPATVLPPGVTIDNVDPPQQPAAARAQLPPPVAPAGKAMQPPARIASAANMPPSPRAEPVVPAREVPGVVKPTESNNAATASWDTGYVAVLSSQKSRMDALKVFANLQEKYGDVLSSRTPDVQVANLGEKGVWYRLLVGPPGSRDAAASLCTQLKAAGYSGCWVTDTLVTAGVQASGQPPQPGIQTMAPQDRERAIRLVKKGDEQLAEGNIAAARIFYERAADAGLAQGAMALASTFDADEIARRDVRGIQPDAKQARHWYERAQQLGASDAEQRLRRIGAN